MGHVIKLLAIAERSDDGKGIGRARAPGDGPADPPAGRRARAPTTRCSSRARPPAQLMFYGRGAGGAPTASAVLGDLVAVGRNRVSGGRGPGESRLRRARRSARSARRVTRYYVGLDVADKAGVLARSPQTFAEHGVSHRDRPAGGPRRRRRPGHRHPPWRPSAALAGDRRGAAHDSTPSVPSPSVHAGRRRPGMTGAACRQPYAPTPGGA